MKEKPKKYFLIPLFIGIAMFVAGIVLVIQANLIEIPSMSDAGWVDAKTAKNFKIFISIALIAVGLMIGIGGTLFVYFADPVVKKRQQLESQEYLSESVQKFSEIANKSKVVEETKVCAYCGSTLSSGAKECPYCGAKKTK